MLTPVDQRAYKQGYKTERLDCAISGHQVSFDSVNCLWSLYEMIYKYGFAFYRLAKWLESMRSMSEILVRKDKIKDFKSEMERSVVAGEGIENILSSLDLPTH